MSTRPIPRQTGPVTEARTGGAVPGVLLAVLVALAGCATQAPDLAEARRLIQSGDHEAGMVILETLAEQGDPEAQFDLSTMFAYGIGVPRNQERAERLSKRSCEAGFWRSCTNYGQRLFQRGYLKEAEAVLMVPAEAGDSLAMEMLIALYEQRGGPGDDEKADAWRRALIEN